MSTIRRSWGISDKANRHDGKVSTLTLTTMTTIYATARGAVVDKLVEYLAHKSIYEKKGATDVPDFTERIAPEIALEL